MIFFVQKTFHMYFTGFKAASYLKNKQKYVDIDKQFDSI